MNIEHLTQFDEKKVAEIVEFVHVLMDGNSSDCIDYAALSTGLIVALSTNEASDKDREKLLNRIAKTTKVSCSVYLRRLENIDI